MVACCTSHYLWSLIMLRCNWHLMCTVFNQSYITNPYRPIIPIRSYFLLTRKMIPWKALRIYILWQNTGSLCDSIKDNVCLTLNHDWCKQASFCVGLWFAKCTIIYDSTRYKTVKWLQHANNHHSISGHHGRARRWGGNVGYYLCESTIATFLADMFCSVSDIRPWWNII